MIEIIKIKNHSLISDSEIHLKNGFNVITGETGAGKSLFINAISTILGQKSDPLMIGKNGEESSITIQINPENFKSLKTYLSEADKKDEPLIIKKVITKDKSRIYINDEIVSQSTLKNLMKDIINICSQHDGQKISNPAFQRKFLDTYSSTLKELEIIKEGFNKKTELLLGKEKLFKSFNNRDQEIDFAKWKLQEIKALNITAEDINLESKIDELKNSKQISDTIKELDPLINGDNSIFSILKELEFHLEKLHKMGKTLNLDKFKELKRDLFSEVRNFDLEPEDNDNLDNLLERLDQINKIKRKYGGSVQSVLDEQKTLKEKIETLENIDSEIGKIDSEIKKIDQALKPTLTKLSEKRKKGAESLNKKITADLQDLNMTGSSFAIKIVPKAEYDQFGQDDISFLIKPHAGQNLAPIEDIASGGELSRVILAIQNNVGEPGCFLFDEIDAGIGGNTGLKIGQKLKEMSQSSQIICITHLHQVAIYSENHLKIEKVQSKNKTETFIHELDSKDQELEIARMVGNDLSNKNQALEYAKDLLNKARSKNLTK